MFFISKIYSPIIFPGFHSVCRIWERKLSHILFFAITNKEPGPEARFQSLPSGKIRREAGNQSDY
ncbi:hypothetical protein L21SP2_2385 [Salinispira pacifica]|uniref:Uncharacterized protein n=1 Tax=Salinispira pacifica TaxID=1307761 RepID=V5WIW8_9SPIO|nr:hypothetical protein L21SP2_2385 [Salinispira pacifica]